MIVLIPMGDVARSVLVRLVLPLEEAFRRRVPVRKPVPLPSPAHDRRRSQYYGPSLLASLPAVGSDTTVVGVVDVDVYTPGLNSVFGLADAEERKPLICLKRLRQEFYGLPDDDELFSERILKEAVHFRSTSPNLSPGWSGTVCPLRRKAVGSAHQWQGLLSGRVLFKRNPLPKSKKVR